MSTVADIRTAIEQRQAVHIGGMAGSAKAHLVAELAEAFFPRTIVVICPTTDRADALLVDTELFTAHRAHAPLKVFPDADVLPYLKLSPEPTRWADRIEVLDELMCAKPLTLIVPITAAMRIVPSKTFLADATRTIRIGNTLDRDELARWLVEHGYTDVGLVEDEGSLAIRGGIIDLWTPTLDDPIRVELDGDIIASIRRFDPSNQRSRGAVKEARIIPAGDLCFTKERTAAALDDFRRRAERKDVPAPERRRVAEMLREHIIFPGIETLSPLFHHDAATLMDYLPREALVIIDEPEEVRHAAAAHAEKLEELAGDSTTIETIVAPHELYRPVDEILLRAGAMQQLTLQAVETLPCEDARTMQVATQTTADIRTLVAQHKPGEDTLSPLMVRLDEWKRAGLHTIFVCHTTSQAERLADLFTWHGLPPATEGESVKEICGASSVRPRILVGRLSEGFVWPDEKIAIVTDEEIFGRKVPRRTITKPPLEIFTSFTELAQGDLLVHEDHGIGRYLGLTHLTIQGIEGDYLLLEYLGGDKLYLPVYRMNLVQRYVGAGEGVPLLDRLGGTRWSRVTKSVRRAIMAMAKDLLRIHAAREVYPGYRFPAPDAGYEEFAAAFPYDETPDQERSIDDVLHDMQQERPMDRLVCGDVGYGKTEVAMRAAFQAAQTGKQVAVLVPTTILALQHYETFIERFKETPLTIEMLSRFRSTKQQKDIIAELKRGTVDIVIGTHRILSRDVSFKDLGLLIIDEEQRFGVKHKERLKKFRETVDVMTLTATPIPRTLHLSLTGIRDISVINTPPADRLSITTHVVPFDEAVIRHAVLNEINREGQVFFVHNRIQTMSSMLARLKRLVPEASMRMAHGQMSEEDLENVMVDFLERDFNVLMCTAIIESGLDIPSANTIIVNRADTFGLAQLYQLRGRVGRSNIKAHAYLLIPQDAPISPAAKKRLMVLKRFTELGSGFQIATHDLEIRGAGNLLGSAQSGHIAQVGYELYTKLLARTIRQLSGKEPSEEIDPELNLSVEAFLPDTYIEEAGARLDCYRRLATCEHDNEVEDIAREFSDRFGPLPAEAKRLIGIMQIKILAKRLRIRQITFDGRTFACQFDSSTPLEPAKLVQLADSRPQRYRLHPPDRLLIYTPGIAQAEGIVEEARNFLSTFISCASGDPA